MDKNYLKYINRFRELSEFPYWNLAKEIFAQEEDFLVNVTLTAIWYHLYNFKNLKNTHGGVSLLVKLQV